MKIAVLTWRAWSAACRYRNLLLNAKALGHEVICVGARWPQSKALIEKALEGTGIPHYSTSEPKRLVGDKLLPVDEVSYKAIEDFEPDVIFGEAIEDDIEGRTCSWAKEHNKVFLALDHGQFHSRYKTWDFIKANYPHVVLMVVNKEQEARALGEGLRAKAVGLPDFDLLEDSYNVDATRAQLGLEEGRPLIGFFLEAWPFRDFQSAEWELLGPFFRLANREGWKVVIHGHPEERWAISTNDGSGLHCAEHRYFYLRWMQDQGGYFVTGFAPGKIGEVEFHLCDPFALIAAADCVAGTTPTMPPKTLVMRKKYVYFQSFKAGPLSTDWPNTVVETNRFENISRIIREGSSGFEPEPEFLERWFYKLDRKAWRRTLDLAKELLHGKT